MYSMIKKVRYDRDALDMRKEKYDLVCIVWYISHGVEVQYSIDTSSIYSSDFIFLVLEGQDLVQNTLIIVQNKKEEVSVRLTTSSCLSFNSYLVTCTYSNSYLVSMYILLYVCLYYSFTMCSIHQWIVPSGPLFLLSESQGVSVRYFLSFRNPNPRS